MEATKQPRRRRGDGCVWVTRYTKQDGTVTETWHVDYWHRGQKFTERAESEGAAHALRLRRLAEIGRGRLVSPIAERTTYADLERAYVADMRARGLASVDNVLFRLRHLDDAFGHMRACDFTSALVARYPADRRAEGAAPATVANEVKHLRAMLRLAAVQGRLENLPVFPRVAGSPAREGYATVEQMTALLPFLPADCRPLALFQFYTAMRPTEAATLTWDRVRFDTAEVLLRAEHTKTRQPRVIVMSPPLQALLEEQRDRTTRKEAEVGHPIEYVFWRGKRVVRPITNLCDALRAASEAAGIASGSGRGGAITAHDLRRSNAAALMDAGVDVPTAMRLMGHKTRSVFDRYAVRSDSALRGAASRFGDYLGRPRPVTTTEPPRNGGSAETPEQIDKVREAR